MTQSMMTTKQCEDLQTTNEVYKGEISELENEIYELYQVQKLETDFELFISKIQADLVENVDKETKQVMNYLTKVDNKLQIFINDCKISLLKEKI